MLDLQNRLPGDNVTGTISFSVSLSFQAEGSEVTIPRQLSATPKHVELCASMSQDSSISEDDHTPLVTLHATSDESNTQSKADDIIPIVMATERATSREDAMPTSPIETPPTLLPEATPLGRQVSDPLFIRQVLYGSSQKVWPGSRENSLQRHRSLFTRRSLERSHDPTARHHPGSVLVKGINSEPSDMLPPSESNLAMSAVWWVGLVPCFV